MINTKAVRMAMRKNGRSMIYTNVLKSGKRAVKCYADRDEVKNAELIVDIKAIAKFMGFAVEIRRTSGSPWGYRSCGAIIAHVKAE